MPVQGTVNEAMGELLLANSAGWLPKTTCEPPPPPCSRQHRPSLRLVAALPVGSVFGAIAAFACLGEQSTLIDAVSDQLAELCKVKLGATVPQDRSFPARRSSSNRRAYR
ncbi:hypothetical protein PMIN03_000281 [Paraphaeosphaeria minitans]